MAWGIEREGHVAIVRMRGTKANVQNERFFADLHEAFDRLEAEFADCAVVLASEEPQFSAGLDFEDSFARLAPAGADGLHEWIRAYQATNLRIWRYPRPTVAAINGAAYAGGLITALDCDYRVGADGAKFSLNEVPIGIAMPAVYVEIIRYAIGTPAAALTTLFGQVYDADDALRLGVIHARTTPDAVLTGAVDAARRVPQEAFEAYAFSKAALQAPALERIEGAAGRLDESLPGVLTGAASVHARARRYEEIKGEPPSWGPS